MSNRLILSLIVLSFMISFVGVEFAKAQLDERAVKCANILYAQANAGPSQRIPQELINYARCIVVIPKMVKAGLVITVESGKGLASCRDRKTGRWGAPAFFNAGGGSIGLSIGGSSFDVITLVMDERGVGGLISESVTFGSAQASAVAGNLGGMAGSHTKGFSFITYTLSEDGLFAGADLGGLKLSFNSKGNAKAYGEPLSAYQTLLEERKIPSQIKIFDDALAKFAPKR